MQLLHLLSYGAAAAAFAFIVLSLASGLLWISELIEENTKTAKVIGQRGIYVIIGLHCLLYFFDSLPLGPTLFSIVCHVVYLQNFSYAWPIISLSSVSFILSCVLVVADHFIWFFHFAKITQDARHRSHRTYGRTSSTPSPPGFADVATFFTLCIWLAPLFLFLSLSANDNALPTLTGTPATPTTPSGQMQTRARSSLFKSIFRLRRRDTSEGLIAPRSPAVASPQTTPILGIPSLNNRPSRPSSPLLGPGLQRVPSPSLPPSFALKIPTRSGTSPQSATERPGFGLRRVASASAAGVLDGL